MAKRVKVRDIRSNDYENWNHHKYEDFNGCPKCNGCIKMRGAVHNKQYYECLSCRQKFVLDAVTEKISFE